MPEDRIRSVVLVGGGVAGWLAAATLARTLRPDFCRIVLIDSPPRALDATSQPALPSFHRLLSLLGIDEADLMRRTRATFRLGTEFRDWGKSGDRYFHTFGSIGARLEAVPFHQYWSRLRQLDEGAGMALDIEDFSIATAAAKQSRFARPLSDPRSVLSHYSYGYHFHAGMLATYLREYAQARGVVHVVRKISEVKLESAQGFIDSLRLDDGTVIQGDLYVDCTGSREGALAQALQGDYIDWAHWVPCDRAVAVPCVSVIDSPPEALNRRAARSQACGERPYSTSLACETGWHWRIPLQQCVDCGFVYSSRFQRDDEALATLSQDLPGATLAEPRLLHLSAGRPDKFWDKNCLTLASSCADPLESTSLHLIQTGVSRLLTLFPVHRFSAWDVAEYNRLTILEHERIRDFLILHYKANTREDSPLWEYCRHMEVPDTLRAKIDLFQSSGRISLLDEEHFGEDSWLSVFLGQGIVPQSHDPLADVLPIEDVRVALAKAASIIRAGVEELPAYDHD